MPLIHSVPLHPPAAACRAAAGRPDPRLRPYVLCYGGFASHDGGPVAHRLLPVPSATLVISFDGSFTLFSGPRADAAVDGPTTWGVGVGVGLTPAGVSVLFGLPMSALAGQIVDWHDVLGPRAAPLAERLAAAPTWPARFALLDEVLLSRLGDPGPAPFVEAAWRRLQGPPIPVGTLADRLGVSRRALEVGFRREIGLSPATLARVFRFQAALNLLADGAGPAGAATAAGYADQPHFTRAARTLAGLTPAQLCAIVQYQPLSGA
ncbi:AraC family transcriptional regulator [Asanoa ishikariensis]|uniref:Helix-turn-helix domain-containing protein n=1 Tax=Asanoa ishikariensis TaxID=137265 RepID=A0A1H3RVV9_9ACTN|nr:helix-turn-helix domain-containing protein [Asanoa ishikariensis]GIF66843.1 AraC family transcriptional regulator [Asanoa ishikariensis]SDZ28999.1 Helix-turn-helix domain-containing protein [Asanoa ishikariensis]